MIRDLFGTFAVLVVLSSALLVSACVTDPAKPEILTRVQTVTVTKEVPVPCVSESEIPPETPTSFPDQPADSYRNASAASADYREMFTENRKLRAILVKCTKGAEQ
jgi:hypothetical protein